MEWGQAKEPASQCTRACQNQPFANYPLVYSPKGSAGHCEGHLQFQGQTLGHPRDTRARNAPVAGRQVPNKSETIVVMKL